jgi:predicted Rossmann-fold nucleotide-binding protein
MRRECPAWQAQGGAIRPDVMARERRRLTPGRKSSPLERRKGASMLRKLPIIGVFGQGTPLDDVRAAQAREVGAMIAHLGAHLLTGSGYGIMAAAAEGFVATDDRAGISIGIVPRAPDGAFNEPNRATDGRPYPNPFVEIAIHTPLPPRTDDWRTTPARNHINVFTADAIVAFPGGSGTRNELDLTAFYDDASNQAPEERRVVLLGPSAEFAPEHLGLFVHAATAADAAGHLARIIAVRGFAGAEVRA